MQVSTYVLEVYNEIMYIIFMNIVKVSIKQEIEKQLILLILQLTNDFLFNLSSYSLFHLAYTLFHPLQSLART